MTSQQKVCYVCLALVVVATAPSAAKIGGAQTTDSRGEALDKAVIETPSADANPHRSRFKFLHRLALSVGPAFLIAGKSAGAASVNLRTRWGDDASPWSLELGGNWPAAVPTDFKTVRQVINNETFTARILSIAEAHITSRCALPHGAQQWIVPEAGFGVSVLQIKDRINVEPGSGTGTIFAVSEQTKTSWSPLLQIGFRLFPEQRISFAFDAAYVSYANVPSYGVAFNLPISGIMLRPLLQVRF